MAKFTVNDLMQSLATDDFLGDHGFEAGSMTWIESACESFGPSAGGLVAAASRMWLLDTNGETLTLTEKGAEAIRKIREQRQQDADMPAPEQAKTVGEEFILKVVAMLGLKHVAEPDFAQALAQLKAGSTRQMVAKNLACWDAEYAMQFNAEAMAFIDAPWEA